MQSLVVSPTGRWLVSTARGDTTRLWDPQAGKTVARLDLPVPPGRRG